jgi:transcriptional/translational regulatory protein YebC/TACO1
MGGNLGAEGSVSYLFTHQGVLSFAPGADEDAIMDIALEEGADDIQADEDGSLEVITTPDAFEAVKGALQAANFEADMAELTMRASLEVSLEGEKAEKLERLVDMLEDLDDVQEVYTNANLDLS